MANHRGQTPYWFLSVVGVLCFVMAGACVFLDRSELLAGGFLIGGIFLVIVGVMAPRMEGGQKVSLTGAEINLASLPEVVDKAEVEAKTERLAEIEDVIK